MKAPFRLIAGALVAIALTHCDPLYANRVLKEVPSPNKQYRALLFERDCGATTNFSTQISLLTSSQSLQGTGNVLIVDFSVSKPSEVQVEWVENRRLRIRYVGREVRVFRQVHKLGAVAVVYDVR